FPYPVPAEKDAGRHEKRPGGYSGGNPPDFESGRLLQRAGTSCDRRGAEVWSAAQGKDQKTAGKCGCPDIDSYSDSKNSSYEPDWNPGYECAGRGSDGPDADPDLCHG